MKLSAPQERMLLGLAEPNKNDDGKWRVVGSGQVRTCQSLVRLGLAKYGAVARWMNVFSLTTAGKARAKEIEMMKMEPLLMSTREFQMLKRIGFPVCLVTEEPGRASEKNHFRPVLAERPKG